MHIKKGGTTTTAKVSMTIDELYALLLAKICEKDPNLAGYHVSTIQMPSQYNSKVEISISRIEVAPKDVVMYYE